MQTRFTARQLADADVASSEQILRKCVHCGFCTATCPTYVLLGDELDSPRGRIYLIKEMLENDRPATQEVVRHVDRCLSCLGCMTTCPSGEGVRGGDCPRAALEATPPTPGAGTGPGIHPSRLEPDPGRANRFLGGPRPSVVGEFLGGWLPKSPRNSRLERGQSGSR